MFKYILLMQIFCSKPDMMKGINCVEMRMQFNIKQTQEMLGMRNEDADEVYESLVSHFPRKMQCITHHSAAASMYPQQTCKQCLSTLLIHTYLTTATTAQAAAIMVEVETTCLKYI